MTPEFPPSSRTTFFFPALFLMAQPTAALPVKLMSLMRSSLTSRPESSLESKTALNPPSGHPACWITSAKRSAVRGVWGSGLEHHGAACGDGRGHFVGDQVQREIKGRDAGDGAEGKTFDDTPTPGSRLLPIQRQIFAVAANRLFGGDIENKDSAVNFGASALDWLACFQRNRAGKFFFAIVNAGRNLAQNSLAFEGGQSPRGSEGLDGGGNGGVCVFAASLIHVRDERAVVRRANIDDVPLFQPPPVQEETMGCNWNHRHLGHALPLSIALVIRV